MKTYFVDLQSVSCHFYNRKFNLENILYPIWLTSNRELEKQVSGAQKASRK